MNSYKSFDSGTLKIFRDYFPGSTLITSALINNISTLKIDVPLYYILKIQQDKTYDTLILNKFTFLFLILLIELIIYSN